MLAKRIKDMLRSGNVSIGAWMSTGHVSIAEILAAAGYDWVVVETEHTAIDVSEVLHLLMAIDGRGVIPLVRLAGIDAVQAKAVMDSGAGGVLVPMVNSKADAMQAVGMVKYPPDGFRGVGLARAQGYGATFADYMARANDESLVIVQIEHVDAVRNIDEILSVPGIDGTFIGPYDLSSSMGVPGQLQHPDVLAAMRHVLEASLRHKVAPGIHLVHPDTARDELQKRVAEGYSFVALGSDILLLGDAARALQSAARDVLSELRR